MTRDYLKNICQDGEKLPDGPVLMNPDSFYSAFYREVVKKTPHEFKIATLQNIRCLFPNYWNPFYAGFGNRPTDERSYREVGISDGKIFTINPSSELVCSSINKCRKTYTIANMFGLLDQMFPAVAQENGLLEKEDYNEWNYWKSPIQIVSIDDEA